MQITSKFTIAVHILTCIEYFQGQETVTSSFLAGSVGAKPVIVRNVMGDLKNAGMIRISQGKSGITLARPLSEITLYDVYDAVDCVSEAGLFHFHENPNASCPVGRNIHKTMDSRLESVQKAMEEELKHITLAEIAEDTRKEIQSEKQEG